MPGARMLARQTMSDPPPDANQHTRAVHEILLANPSLDWEQAWQLYQRRRAPQPPRSAAVTPVTLYARNPYEAQVLAFMNAAPGTSWDKACQIVSERNAEFQAGQIAKALNGAKPVRPPPAHVLMSSGARGARAAGTDVSEIPGRNIIEKAVHYLRANLPGYSSQSWENQIDIAGKHVADGRLVGRGQR